ncbi:MAG: GGDEF domain-containing protein [Gammaproteobacteria bacterium]
MRFRTNTLLSSLLRLFSAQQLEFEEARKRLLFGAFSLASAFLCFSFSIHHFTEGSLRDCALIALVGFALVFTVVFVRGRVDGELFYRVPAVLFCALFVYFATLGDTVHYRMLWLYTYPPMVFFLVGVREGMAYVTIVSIAWVAALLLPSSVSGSAIYDPEFSSRFLASFGLVIATSFFLEAVRGYYAESQRIHSMKLERDHLQMHDLAYNDDLTQLPNRRSVVHMIDDTLAALSFDDEKTALIGMLDIDRFKTINDHFGHQVGDLVLRNVAKRVSNAIRSNDFVGRYGGEEFVLVIPGAKEEQYQVILEKVRLAVCKRPISIEGVLHHVTVSIGGTNANHEYGREVIIDQADQALYVAKQSGRNRCVIYRKGLDASDATVTVAS